MEGKYLQGFISSHSIQNIQQKAIQRKADSLFIYAKPQISFPRFSLFECCQCAQYKFNSHFIHDFFIQIILQTIFKYISTRNVSFLKIRNRAFSITIQSLVRKSFRKSFSVLGFISFFTNVFSSSLRRLLLCRVSKNKEMTFL